jgi:hypothetical protein
MLKVFMLTVIYTECRNKPFMMNAVVLNVVILNVIMLNVVMLNVVMLSVMTPYKEHHTCRHPALPSDIRRGCY